MADFPGFIIDPTVLSVRLGVVHGGSYEGLFRPFGSSKGPAPRILNLTPPAGTALARNGAVSFDLDDPDGNLETAIFTARFTSFGAHEVVWDGERFADTYRTSTRTPIVNGYHYTLRRAGGWPGAFTLRLFAVDLEGSVAT